MSWGDQHDGKQHSKIPFFAFGMFHSWPFPRFSPKIGSLFGQRLGQAVNSGMSLELCWICSVTFSLDNLVN